ncbi:MAG: heavy-metal-associated domain-containing protein [Rhodospirillales bacterium]|nr:heavy-metal-associated domain-containing protein [Rhodospirillales bacterium]
MTTIKLLVNGMSCQGCADSLTRRLTDEPGVTKVLVSLEYKTANVEYDVKKLTKTRLSEVVQEAGFSVQ